MEYKIYNNNCLEQLDQLQENCIDSIVTDPPYELNFMGKGWDNAGVSFNKETWQKCLRVLKPGGYLLAFGGSRTFHRIAVAIEDAGFEIRDTIMWLYGSGFPKSMNIGLAIDKRNGVDNRTGNIVQGMASNNTESLNNHKYETQNFKKEYEERVAQNEWAGWGTALKPSFEPIVVARKPFKGSLVDNVIEWGVGGLNIDECRVGTEEISYYPTDLTEAHSNKFGNGAYMPKDTTKPPISHNGRFPANTILTYDQITFDEVCGGFPQNQKPAGNKKAVNYDNKDYDNSSYKINYTHNPKIAGDNGGSASRYFYCAKASKKDRDEGLNEFEDKKFYSNLNTKNGSGERLDGGKTPIRKNIHPTVKPTELMQYLVRLVTPNGGTVLDPFMGSGSTGKAVAYENQERNKDYKFIGIELNKEYCEIAKARINYAGGKNEEESI